MPDHASWRRRIAALVIDWAASSFVVIGLLGPGDYANDPNSSWVVLGVFALEVSLLTTLAGGSFGQLLARIRVLRTDGRPLSLLASVARTLLICLVVPPLVFKPETGRGLHDLWTGSAAYVRN
ncbi:MAG: hypothetical protein JWR85_683 [Marmoricola sp.]|nr:hypothetical protein [Marmoricola sp.]